MHSPFASVAARRAFVVRAAELLQAHGTPAHRLESLIGRLCDRLGLRASVFSTPTVVQLAFEGHGQPAMHQRRIQPGNVDLGKLVEFDEVLDEHEAGRLSLFEAREALEQVAVSARRFRGTAVPAYGVASASAAVLFGGGLLEVAAAFGLGLTLGLAGLFIKPRLQTPQTFELGAAFVMAIAAQVLRLALPALASDLVVLASLVVLLPGLTLTVGTIELATGHLASGTARMAGGLAVLLSLTLGVALGRVAASPWVPGPADAVLEPLGLAGIALVALAPVAFALLLRARPAEFGWIFVGTMVGLVASRLGYFVLGEQLAPFAGALALGVFANAFARTRHRPATVVLTPGLLTLVPGSVGYRAALLFVNDDTVAAVATAFDASLVAVALAGGILVGNTLLSPRRSL